MKKKSMKEKQQEILRLVDVYDGANDAFSNPMGKLLKFASAVHHGFAGSRIWLKLIIGWGTRIRTWDGGIKIRCLTAWLYPNFVKCL